MTPRTRHLGRLRSLCLFGCLAVLASRAVAAEYRGQVVYGGLPVPGAMVTVVQGSKTFTTVTDEQGAYSFPDLGDGAGKLKVEMLCFSPIEESITIAAGAPAARWELKLLSIEQIRAQGAVAQRVYVAPEAPKTEKPKTTAQGTPEVAPPPPPPDDASQRAADGLLINGSSNNAATSAYSLSQAFGNRRNGNKGLYNGGFSFIIDNSTFDARQYSLSGQESPKPAYNLVTAGFTFGGPIRIPHLIRNGPNFFVAYEWTRNSISSSLSALVPNQAQRGGDLSGLVNSAGQQVQIINPATGQPFANNQIPISAQAQALLNLYPLPNVAANSRYNFQIPVLNSTHLDAMQTRLDKSIGRRDQIYGRFAFQTSRAGSTNFLGFADKTNSLGLNTNINWQHRFNPRTAINLGYQFSRLSSTVTPFWKDRANISGQAGITGNNQESVNWGPPTLSFVSITGMSDVQSSFNRNRTDGVSLSATWNRSPHNVTVGVDFRKQEFNDLFQQDPRGTFSFTGAATQGTATGSGSDFADFLIGVPDTSSIAFGNADKYLRQNVYDAYFTDDWRINSQFTAQIGMRWEYGSPMTELKNRLVNLDIASGFTAEHPVLASDPVGTLTNQHYPASLIRPDRRSFEPRVAVSWRPIAGSSMVVRAGYGIYSDTSVYQATTLRMAQQAPLSKSLSVSNSPSCQLTLANGFNSCNSTTQNTFAVDPNFRVGYAQVWQLAVQRDLPAALQMTATYLGIKGTRGVQQFLPNTYPVGAANPCLSCPIGFIYRTSNGNSTRESGQLQLRRRLRSGFTATLQYVYSKSIDNDSQLGGQGATLTSNTSTQISQGVTAQNWRDLNAERGLSTFDQRHLLTFSAQYTSGMGSGGGTLMSGWRGRALKEWTMLTSITAGTGLPLTPFIPSAVPETGVTGSIRANYTGASIHAAPAGLFLNPAAFTAPAAGQWGNASRGSITGPHQFTLNASAARTFRMTNRFNLDLHIDATNLLNHVNFTSWNTVVTSTQYGLPVGANNMRSLQTTLRLRF
jgi:trimeric autotransporter adhesin